jgi:hypothetical protein
MAYNTKGTIHKNKVSFFKDKGILNGSKTGIKIIASSRFSTKTPQQIKYLQNTCL